MTPRTFALFAALTAYSSLSAADIKGLVIVNAEFGGDQLVTGLSYGDGSKPDIDAGRGIVAGGGIEFGLTPDLAVQALASYKFTTIVQASNGDVTWTRIPLDLLAYYRIASFRIGAGVTYNLNNQLEGTGAASIVTRDFDNALGYVGSFEYVFTPKFSVTGRYTMINYTPSAGGADANGNNFGVGINWYFFPK